MSAPYYADDHVTLWHGDALEILPTVAADSFAAVITDPPYNFGFDYGEFDDDKTADAYEAWCTAWYGESRRVAARVLIFPGHGNLGMWHRIAKPSGIGCWHKPGNPKGGGVFQFCEWEPFLLYGGGVGGSDVIRATVTRQFDTENHPCPKPLSLMRQVVSKVKSGPVLDPFAGSGTTLVAAKWAGLASVGVEQNESYCEIAARRLSQGVLDFGEPA